MQHSVVIHPLILKFMMRLVAPLSQMLILETGLRLLFSQIQQLGQILPTLQ